VGLAANPTFQVDAVKIVGQIQLRRADSIAQARNQVHRPVGKLESNCKARTVISAQKFH
jgi:hypothetical protein